jgi:hypothetical protein
MRFGKHLATDQKIVTTLLLDQFKDLLKCGILFNDGDFLCYTRGTYMQGNYE